MSERQRTLLLLALTAVVTTISCAAVLRIRELFVQ